MISVIFLYILVGAITFFVLKRKVKASVKKSFLFALFWPINVIFFILFGAFVFFGSLISWISKIIKKDKNVNFV